MALWTGFQLGPSLPGRSQTKKRPFLVPNISELNGPTDSNCLSVLLGTLTEPGVRCLQWCHVGAASLSTLRHEACKARESLDQIPNSTSHFGSSILFDEPWLLVRVFPSECRPERPASLKIYEVHLGHIDSFDCESFKML